MAVVEIYRGLLLNYARKVMFSSRSVRYYIQMLNTGAESFTITIVTRGAQVGKVCHPLIDIQPTTSR